MLLFQYAIILRRTEKDRKDGVGEDKILVMPTTVLTKDQSMATMLAVRAIPAEHADKIDRIEVAVRPF
jgi:hypothetical protein